MSAASAKSAPVNRPVRHVVILGAGQAGAEAAFRLRGHGFDGAITLLGAEPFAPYQRPPLSKAFLLGEMSAEALLVRDFSAFAAERIDLRLNETGVAIDRTAHEIRLASGEALAYDRLILATGSRARRPAFASAEMGDVHVLRTIADVDRLRPEMRAGAHLAVIGAGYVGLEVAAVARKSGLEVTIFEAANRPLARVAHPLTARFFRDLHEDHGIRFEFNAEIAGLERSGLRRADGSRFACDLTLFGIGGAPESALAEASGLACNDGIVVDSMMRTADPAIYAIGDCCRRPMPFYDQRPERLESVHNALETARLAAFAIAQEAHPDQPLKAPILETPWFWSDQYDVKLQIAGLSAGHDQIVLRGEASGGTAPGFALFYLAAGRVIAADCVNAPAEFLGAKKLVQEQRAVAQEILRDTSVPMKDILRRSAAPKA